MSAAELSRIKGDPAMPTVDDFKQKYAAAFELMEHGGVRLDHLHVQDDKMVMTGAASSEEVRNAVWNAIKSADPTFSDTSIQLDVDPSVPAPPPQGQSYTVKSGDTLWKIAEHFYGNGAEYKKIVAANNIEDENKIDVGQHLTIPA